MKELWREIKNYEGLYSISNMGRVYSHRRGRCLKPSDNGTGYFQVELTKQKEHKYVYVHRLVASAFVDNPNSLNEINHRDCDKSNNKADNLEWCTKDYNLNYGDRAWKVAKANKQRCNKGVYQLDADGNVLKKFSSVADASRSVGGNHANIIKCIKNEIKHAYGYRWRYCEA